MAKKQLLFMFLLFISVVSGTLNYDVEIVTDQDVNIGFDIEAQGDVNITENYNHYSTTLLTKKSTNREGVLKTLNKMFSYWFGEDELRNPDRYEMTFLGYLSRFYSKIVNDLRTDYIYSLELDLKAQKKINKMYQQEIDNIYNKLYPFLEPVHNQSIQCVAYLEMLKEHDDIKSVTCMDGEEVQTWHKTNGYAIMIS